MEHRWEFLALNIIPIDVAYIVHVIFTDSLMVAGTAHEEFFSQKYVNFYHKDQTMFKSNLKILSYTYYYKSVTANIFYLLNLKTLKFRFQMFTLCPKIQVSF